MSNKGRRASTTIKAIRFEGAIYEVTFHARKIFFRVSFSRNIFGTETGGSVPRFLSYIRLSSDTDGSGGNLGRVHTKCKNYCSRRPAPLAKGPHTRNTGRRRNFS